MKKFLVTACFALQASVLAHPGGHDQAYVVRDQQYANLIFAASSGKISNRVTLKKDKDYITIETNSIPDHGTSGGRGPNTMKVFKPLKAFSPTPRIG